MQEPLELVCLGKGLRVAQVAAVVLGVAVAAVLVLLEQMLLYL
jgi:hypothetical protein